MIEERVAATGRIGQSVQVMAVPRRGLSLRAREAIDCYVFMLPAILGLIFFWIGPMLFLSALALLLSLLLGPSVATLVSLGLWATKLLASGYSEAGSFVPVGAGLLDEFWRANMVLLPLAAVLLAAALLLAPKTERFAT